MQMDNKPSSEDEPPPSYQAAMTPFDPYTLPNSTIANPNQPLVSTGVFHEGIMGPIQQFSVPVLSHQQLHPQQYQHYYPQSHQNYSPLHQQQQQQQQYNYQNYQNPSIGGIQNLSQQYQQHLQFTPLLQQHYPGQLQIPQAPGPQTQSLQIQALQPQAPQPLKILPKATQVRKAKPILTTKPKVDHLPPQSPPFQEPHQTPSPISQPLPPKLCHLGFNCPGYNDDSCKLTHESVDCDQELCFDGECNNLHPRGKPPVCPNGMRCGDGNISNNFDCKAYHLPMKCLFAVCFEPLCRNSHDHLIGVRNDETLLCSRGWACNRSCNRTHKTINCPHGMNCNVEKCKNIHALCVNWKACTVKDCIDFHPALKDPQLSLDTIKIQIRSSRPQPQPQQPTQFESNPSKLVLPPQPSPPPTTPPPKTSIQPSTRIEKNATALNHGARTDYKGSASISAQMCPGNKTCNGSGCRFLHTIPQKTHCKFGLSCFDQELGQCSLIHRLIACRFGTKCSHQNSSKCRNDHSSPPSKPSNKTPQHQINNKSTDVKKVGDSNANNAKGVPDGKDDKDANNKKKFSKSEKMNHTTNLNNSHTPTKVITGPHHYIDPFNIENCFFYALKKDAILNAIHFRYPNSWICEKCPVANHSTKLDESNIQLCWGCKEQKTSKGEQLFDQLVQDFGWLKGKETPCSIKSIKDTFHKSQ